MKTYQQLKEETVELNEVFGLGSLFGNHQTRDIEKRIKNARENGPDAEAKEKLNIYQELLKGIINIVKAHPRKVAAGLGIFLADITIASTRRDMYRAGAEGRGESVNPNDLPKSITGMLAGMLIDAMGESALGLIRKIYPYVIALIFAGFSIVGIYQLLRVLVVRGPQYLDALITTRDERALAYTLKKEFDTDVFTSGIRTGSPGQGKITSTGARRGRPPKNPTDDDLKDSTTFAPV